MARKKPVQAAKSNAAERSPENDLRHCILYLCTFGGSNLEELAEATGLDVNTVDLYMVGQKPLSRPLVERFCKVAGTSLPRVELALPAIYWMFDLLASTSKKKRWPKAEVEGEGTLQWDAVKIAFSVYDRVVEVMKKSFDGPYGPVRWDEPYAQPLEAKIQLMAKALGEIAGETFREGALVGLEIGKQQSPRHKDEAAG